MKVKESLNTLIKKRGSVAAKQSIAMFSSNILGLGLGIIVSVVNTRMLGPEDYGDLKYLLNLFALGVVLLTGGYSYTGSRAIALNEYQNVKEKLLGGLYAINLFIAFIFTLLLFIASYIIDSYFENDVGPVIRFFIPLLFVFPFHNLLEKILEGENRIYDLAIFRVGSKALYIATIFLVSIIGVINLKSALAIHILTLLAVIAYVFFKKIPDFKKLNDSISKLKKLNKKHGLQIYTGSLVGNGSEYLGSIFIGAFMSNINVGYYSLATTVATPLFMIPQSLGTVFFKKFANSKKIPKSVLLSTIGISLLVFFAFNIVVEYVVLFVYSEEYLPVIKYTRIISFAIVIKGFGFFLNRFLHSHGLGKELRDASFLRGLVNVPGFYFLVKYFDVYGACITVVLSNVMVLIYLVFKYRRYTRSINE